MDCFMPKSKYESIEGDEEDVTTQSQLQKTYKLIVLSKIQQWAVTIICISIISTAIITSILLLLLLQMPQLDRQLLSLIKANSTASTGGPGSCGTSPSEARSLGCTFDLFVNGWVPASCYNALVATKSESGTTYPVFWDTNHTRPATREDLEHAAFSNSIAEDEALSASGISSNLQFFHTTNDWHRAHCLHLWRLAASAVESHANGVRGVGIYSKAAELKHAMHCSNVIEHFEQREKDHPGSLGGIAPSVVKCVGLDDVWDVSYGR